MMARYFRMSHFYLLLYFWFFSLLLSYLIWQVTNAVWLASFVLQLFSLLIFFHHLCPLHQFWKYSDIFGHNLIIIVNETVAYVQQFRVWREVTKSIVKRLNRKSNSLSTCVTNFYYFNLTILLNLLFLVFITNNLPYLI